MQDARWLAQLHRCGLIEGSMVPEQDIRDLRDLTRYRSKMVQAVTAEKNRIHKILQDANIKLTTFMSDLYGGFGTGPAPEDHGRRGRRRSGR
ncbi:transposase [Paenibacillus rhizoplanae]